MATPDPFAAIEACFANDRAMISALIEEKAVLRIELTKVKAELRIQQRLTELAREASRSCDRSRSPRIAIAKSPSFCDETETEARDLFRNILAHHYIDGHPCGNDADDWLRKHGGWFPDPQVLYGDGTSVPEDEGMNVRGRHPDALEEAFDLISKLNQWLLSANLEDMSDDVRRYISNQIKKLRSKNPRLAPV